MAGSSNMSITRELFELTRSREYVTYIPSINSRDRTGIAAFNETDFANDYDVDTSFLYPKGRRMNTYHVYEQFGRLAGMDGTEVKKCMLQEVESQKKYYQARGNVVLSLMQTTIEDWIAMHRYKRARADELCIFALSVLFNRHTVIFTSTKPWCTMDPHGHEHHRNFLSICDIHLLNLGDNMFINLKPREEARVFSTLPQGITMSIFNDTTQFHEISYEITPPVLDNVVQNNPEDDCTVLDYFPHRTPDTRKKNRNQNNKISTPSSPTVQEIADLTVTNQPMNLTVNVDDEVPLSRDDISCSNDVIKQSEIVIDAEPNSFSIVSAMDEKTAGICDNSSPLNEVATSNIITENANCNNILNQLCFDDVRCNNIEMDLGRKVTYTPLNELCDKDTIPIEGGLLNNDMTDSNNHNEVNNSLTLTMTCNNGTTVNDSSANYKPVKWDNTLISHINEDHCDISPLSLEDSPSKTLCTQNTTPDEDNLTGSNVELDSSRYSPEVSDISYDSDASSHSCTTLSSTDEEIVPTLVRVSKDIMDEMGNKECWLLLPKLPQLTIDYWKNRDNKIDSAVKPLPEPAKDCDKNSDVAASSLVENKINIDESTVNKMEIEPMDSKPINQTVENKNDNISGNESDIHQTELSEYDSPTSESDSLINPVKSKTVRRKRKRVNYADMCKDSSDSDEDLDRNRQKIKEKPLPGTGPSLSRLRAQELISRHRVIDHPSDPVHLETSSDLEVKYNAFDKIDYSGDTDEYTVPSKPIIKPEQDDTFTEQPIGTDNVFINKTVKAPDKPSKPKPKRKPTKSIKNRNMAPSILKLKKSGSKGEWEIKSYARVKHRKVRSHKCPANSCHFKGESTHKLNEHYRSSHPPLPCKFCQKLFNNPSSLRHHSYWHSKINSSGMFKCNRCSYSCPFESTLNAHKDKHRRGMYSCFSSGCGKTFRRESSLNAHVKLHTGKDIHCDKCDYVCRDQRYLTQHYRSHTKEKKFFCNTCGKGFSFYQQKKRHHCN